MKTVEIIGLVILGFYILLNMSAAILGKNAPLNGRIINAIGCVILIVFYVLMFFNYKIILLLIAGLLVIHISAFSIGIKLYKKINITHHIVRLLVSIVITILFVV